MIKAGFDGLIDLMPGLKNHAKNIILMGAYDLIKKLESDGSGLEGEIMAIREKMKMDVD